MDVPWLRHKGWRESPTPIDHAGASHLSRRQDQSYKLLFSLSLAVEHLIRGFISERLADELDFGRTENLATERTTSGLVRSQADLLWKVHFRGSSRYLILPIEFQSEGDRYMSVRMLYYVAIAYHGLAGLDARRRQLAPGGMLPPILAITIYNGRKRWQAPADVFDLIEPVRGWLTRFQPRLQSKVLDLRGVAGQPPPEPNVVSWIASMELDPATANVSRVVENLRRAYPGAQHVRLREAFREWILGAAESWGMETEVLERVKSLKEATMMYAGVEELKERAHREGRAEGSATVVCRQAGLKFGPQVADRLSKLLEGLSDPERIARIGDRIFECETGAEFLARAREV